MSQTEKSGLHEFAGGDVRLWAEAGEPIMLKAIDSEDPVELTADEARSLARALLALADWCEST